MSAPDVSIVIPTYNRAQWTCRAVRSCLSAAPAVEVVVVDDGSEEPIEQVLREEFGAEGVVYVRQAHQGACVARNTGMAWATGEYVKFLDSDDVLIQGVLDREVHAAREAGANVLVTGWEERLYDESGREQSSWRHTVSAPDLREGIDAMLLGRGPWTSAALYKRSFVRDLRWDPAWTKAQDWGWALTVCLAGATFASLDEPSAIYNHHPANRITASADAAQRSTEARQSLLRMVERNLCDRGALTEGRRLLLAQYYYKDALALCEESPGAWKDLWHHCEELVPGFRPRETSRRVRTFVRVAGVYRGVLWYARLKRFYMRATWRGKGASA